MFNKTHNLRQLPGARTARRGLSFLELMISLAITSMLLTAVAASFHASSQVVQANDEFFRATQAGRVSMNQMVVSLRRALSVMDVQTDFIHFNDENNKEGWYIYDAATHQIQYVPGNDINGAKYVLASNVMDMALDKKMATDAGGKAYATLITIRMTVEVGHNLVTLTGSVAPRQKQEWT